LIQPCQAPRSPYKTQARKKPKLLVEIESNITQEEEEEEEEAKSNREGKQGCHSPGTFTDCKIP